MKISLEKARELLTAGDVVAVPTETVYGLGALLSHPQAIEKIYALKGRPKQNPLIIHLHDISLISFYTSHLPPKAEALMSAFWPGPLTLVLPAHLERVPKQVRSNLSTAAFRIPKHPLILDLLQTVGPLVAPSANLSGRPSSTTALHIEEDFGSHFPILDGGEIDKGIESTILAYQEERWKIGRLGSIPADSFAPILGYIPEMHRKTSDHPLCPGAFYRHYAPNCALTLSFLEKCSGGVILGYTDRIYPNASLVIPLGESSNPFSIMKNLYASLRKLDQMGIKEAFVDTFFPKEGLYLTIYERFLRAAEKKD